MAKIARIFRKGVYKWVPINRASTKLTSFWCSALVSSACAFAARLLNAATFPTKKWHSQHSLSSSDSYKTQNNSYIKQLPYSLNSLPRASCYERVINQAYSKHPKDLTFNRNEACDLESLTGNNFLSLLKHVAQKDRRSKVTPASFIV